MSETLIEVKEQKSDEGELVEFARGKVQNYWNGLTLVNNNIDIFDYKYIYIVVTTSYTDILPMPGTGEVNEYEGLTIFPVDLYKKILNTITGTSASYRSWRMYLRGVAPSQTGGILTLQSDGVDRYRHKVYIQAAGNPNDTSNPLPLSVVVYLSK